MMDDECPCGACQGEPPLPSFCDIPASNEVAETERLESQGVTQAARDAYREKMDEGMSHAGR